MTKKLELSIRVLVDVDNDRLSNESYLDDLVRVSRHHVYSLLMQLDEINVNVVKNGVISKISENDEDKLKSKLTLMLVEYHGEHQKFLQRMNLLSTDFVTFSIGYGEGDEYCLTAIGYRLTAYTGWSKLSDLLVSIDKVCEQFSRISVDGRIQVSKEDAIKAVDEIVKWKSQHFPGEDLVVE